MESPVSHALLRALLSQLRDVVALKHTIDTRPLKLDTGAALSRAEINTISAVAQASGLSLTALASQQKVTKGAASQMVSRLVKKGLLSKAPASGRTIRVTVTERGARAHGARVASSQRLLDAVQASYADDTTVLRDLEALNRLLSAMRRYSLDET